jgi:hypothetical protein
MQREVSGQIICSILNVPEALHPTASDISHTYYSQQREADCRTVDRKATVTLQQRQFGLRTARMRTLSV